MTTPQKPRELVERLRQRLARATAGPWQLQDGCSWRRIGTQMHDGNVLCPTTHHRDHHPDLTAGKGEDTYANLELIVEAINALPDLLDMIEALLATPRHRDLTRPLDWQDIRLHAGEGELSAQTVLDAANAELRARAAATPQDQAGEMLTAEPAGDDVERVARVLERYAYERGGPYSLDAETDARRIVEIVLAALHPTDDLRRTREAAQVSANEARAEVVQLRHLLKPFAEAADNLDDAHGDNSEIWEASAAMSITAGDLRRAHTFLSTVNREPAPARTALGMGGEAE